jgi:RimJ/RimL family protein N-acetyltransferase
MNSEPSDAPEVIDAGWMRLRPFTPEDVDWVHRVSLDPVVRTFIDLPTPYLRSDAEYFVERVARERVERLAEDAATGRRLGRVGLHPRPGGAAEIGYWVDPAARALCRWAFTSQGVGIVHWQAQVGNDASRRVAERTGFRIEATLRQRAVREGRRVDVWVGSLLPGELR